ncbi:hypothetical protein PS918_01795 [Pseudomonas fluorescens]|uniref:Uncharacterized protein n=1 Tax=Pseudomonas fluorescens TaxID=294 RepID=A0A5E7RP72_PSEFL|nr:hypothetical protein [Pseudomonas fluorescens]VVP75490.1 hypothetical protein PS918_01795 [Pseudomonas fluorescens]
MNELNAPTAAHLSVLANLSDAALLAPLSIGDVEPAEALPMFPVQAPAPVAPLPSLEELLAEAESVFTAETAQDLYRRTLTVGGVHPSETVSTKLAGNGQKLSDALRNVVGETLKTPDDLRYAMRVFAAHAVNSLIGNRRDELMIREAEAAKAVHNEWEQKVLVAARGEVAAIQASGKLSAEEFEFLLELVDGNKAGMAQNLAGPDVDVPALVAGRGTDWRSIANSWAGACKSRGAVTFEAGADAAGPRSFCIEVQPEAGWVLMTHVDQQWIPIEASADGTARAISTREQAMLVRSLSAKPAPYFGVVFADKLRGAV